MPSKPFPWKCGRCRERSVFPATLDTYAIDTKLDGQSFRIELADFAVYQCRDCGSKVLDDAANDRISDAIRAAAGRLSPESIRLGRESAGWTSGQLAERVGVSVATVSRWEAGHQIQSRAEDARLRQAYARLAPAGAT